MSNGTIITGPHLLYASSSKKTYGITVQSLGSVDEIEKRGYQRKFYINDYSLNHYTNIYKEYLSLSDEEYNKILFEINEMVEKQL